MARAPKQDLFDLLQEIFSNPCISVSSDTLGAGPSASTGSGDKNSEYQTISLLLLELRTASLLHLVEFLLQILLNQPPFTHTSPELLVQHRSRFFEIWSRDYDAASSAGAKNDGNNDEQSIQPQQCLQILAEIRMNFQRLNEDGFRFVSELLLSCLTRLSLVNAGSGRNWVVEHGKAVKILSDLLYSVPDAGWVRLGKNFEYTVTVWKCLKLLTAGAPWWESKSKIFEKNIMSLSKCFFALPTVSSLLRAAVRVELRPAEIFSVIDLLLIPLERLHGITTSDSINAFTPTPFNFPVFSSLAKHDFTRPYELANLRVLFVSWISSDTMHRDLEEFSIPWSMSMVLQHPEASNRLKLHPESGVRIALAYIFNEVQLGGRGFKPSTDMKAVELLKIFITNKHKTRPVSASTTLKPLESSPEACITMNSEWVLPWLWQRRGTDLDFVMTITSAWMLATCREEKELNMKHPMIMILEKNRIVLEVFSDLFKHLFLYGGVSSSTARIKLRRLLGVILQAVRLMFDSKPEETSPELYSQIIQCFTNSVEQDWIPISCWESVCMLFAKTPRLVLSEAFTLAHGIDKMDIFIQVFLREIEGITSRCEGNNSVHDLSIKTLGNQFRALTAVLQFVILAGRVNIMIRQFLVAKTHFILSMLKYINQEYKSFLLSSPHPELLWMHAASVGAACEILIVTGFGVDTMLAGNTRDNTNIPCSRGMTEQARNQEILKMISRLVGHAYEMSYIISPLCELTAMLSANWWIKKPFIYFDLFGYIRMVLLQNGTHKWCCLVPVLVHAVEALLKVDAPIRQMLVENRWNLELTVTMITRLKDGNVCCEDCGVDFQAPILKLVTLMIERRPRWCRDLLLERRLGQYSMLTLDIVDTIFGKQMEQINSSTQTGEDHLALAGMAVRIASVFPEWQEEETLKIMRERLERAVMSSGGKKRCSRKGVCEVFRPVEEVSICLVPNYEIGFVDD